MKLQGTEIVKEILNRINSITRSYSDDSFPMSVSIDFQTGVAGAFGITHVVKGPNDEDVKFKRTFQATINVTFLGPLSQIVDTGEMLRRMAAVEAEFVQLNNFWPKLNGVEQIVNINVLMRFSETPSAS